VTRVRERRAKLLYQLLITLSIFDILASIAYAFTSLPTPKSDFIDGSKGNDATCTAQGFFIQLGTTACMINSSLSIYYYLTIIHGHSEEAMKEKRLAFFIPPIVIGVSFAFIGIPWYWDMLIWCNNSASWWPEIPVIFSIVLVTVVMGCLCYNVRKTERATRRYSVNNTRGLSKMVVKQSLLFVGAFYMCWVPYLSLQYNWAAGKAYFSFGFVLYAAASVPLQGFLNMIVYVKPRYLKRGSTFNTSFDKFKIPKCKLSWCFKKRTPSSTDDDKMDRGKVHESQIESTSKLTKHPNNESEVAVVEYDDTFDHCNRESKLHQSVQNSLILGEGSLSNSYNDEVTKSTLQQSVLNSSMLGEKM
jgi:hypothetical protein